MCDGQCCLGAAGLLGQETAAWGWDFGAENTQYPERASGPVFHPLPPTACLSFTAFLSLFSLLLGSGTVPRLHRSETLQGMLNTNG